MILYFWNSNKFILKFWLTSFCDKEVNQNFKINLLNHATYKHCPPHQSFEILIHFYPNLAGERSHMTSARFWQIFIPPVSIERPPCWRQHLPDPPTFQSDTRFSKNPLHSTLIGTLNVYLIQLKTERCQVNFMYIRLGQYINAVVSRIVIGPLDLKQFLPKFKYFCWR